MADQQITSTDDAERLYANPNATAVSLLAATRWVIANKRSLVSFFTKLASFGQTLGDAFDKVEDVAGQIEFSIANSPKGKPSRDNAVTRKQARQLLRFVLDHDPDTTTVFQIDKEIIVSGAKAEAKFLKDEVVDPAINAAKPLTEGIGAILLVAGGALALYYLTKSSSPQSYDYYGDEEY